MSEKKESQQKSNVLDPVSIEKFIPQDAVITLGGKEYELRKVNARDEVWLKEVFGAKLQFIFQELDFDSISKIIFRLLKDKTDFLPHTIEGHDDDGRVIDVFVSGPQRVLEAISGIHEKQEAYFSLMHCIGISRPVVDKMVEEELERQAEEDKKKVTKSEESQETLAGQKSSTQSPVSTDTQSSNSEA